MPAHLFTLFLFSHLFILYYFLFSLSYLYYVNICTLLMLCSQFKTLYQQCSFYLIDLQCDPASHLLNTSICLYLFIYELHFNIIAELLYSFYSPLMLLYLFFILHAYLIPCTFFVIFPISL